MKRGLFALILATFLGGGSASAMICSGGQSKTETNHTTFEHACYEYFFNNSGATRYSGDVVVIDYTGTGVNSSTETNADRNAVDVNASDGDVDNIGTYITTSTTADDEKVVGVIDDDSCADQTYCRVQVRGPRLTRCADGTDNITAGDAVSTSTVAGQCGDAANDADGILGWAMQGGGGADNGVLWVWIEPGTNE